MSIFCQSYVNWYWCLGFILYICISCVFSHWYRDLWKPFRIRIIMGKFGFTQIELQALVAPRRIFFFNSVFIFWTHYINKINPRVPGSLTYLRAFKGLWSQKFCIYKYKRGQFWAIFWPSLTPPLPKTNNNHQYSPSVTTTFNCFYKEISAHLISRPISCDNLIPFLVNLSLCFEL